VEETHFLQISPSDALELSLELEAQRFAALGLTPRDFARHKARAAQALHSLRSGTPEALAEQRLRALVFQGLWAYSHPMQGSPNGLLGVPLSNVLELHQRHARADRVALTLVGNFRADQAKALIERHFSGLGPRHADGSGAARDRTASTSDGSSELPRQTSERFSAAEQASLKQPLVYYGWGIPTEHGSSTAALRLVAEILSAPDSRLASELARPRPLGRDPQSWLLPQRGPSAVVVSLRVEPGATVDQARARLESELSRLAKAGPTDAELEGARARLERAASIVQSEPAARARALGEAELRSGTGPAPRPFDAIARGDVQRAVSQHLQSGRRTSVELYPSGWPQDPAPAIVRQKHVVKAGDNLIQIARRYGALVNDIAEENGIRKSRFIFPGQVLVIPKRTGGAAPAQKTYVVRRGDSLSVIAQRHGVTTAQLSSANGKKPGARIVVGEKLVIPSAVASRSPPRAVGRSHRVRKGDTWLGLARRYGVSVDDLARANGRRPKQPIYAGEELRIPSGAK
jgi:LysM repeat protein/predicted Zn-dependent peptidase